MPRFPIPRWILAVFLIVACSGDRQLLNPLTDNRNFTVGTGMYDFGDAPNGAFPTLLASNGARHEVGALFLGAAVDAEADGQPNGPPNGATGDDKNGSTPDDEDGVTFTSPPFRGTTVNVDIVASQAGGLLNAWIDFNGNGSWEAGAPEQIFIDQALSMGVNNLSFGIPAGAALGIRYARFRLSTTGGLLPTGSASDGEVEDYQFTITDTGTFDFGDAPNGTYPTRFVGDGARHIIGSLFLGAAVDGEPDGQPNVTATGDDRNGSTPDDEDGVTFTSLLSLGATASVDVVASAAGLLNAWIDFNVNGIWEAGEQIFTNQALAMGINNLTFSVPAGATVGMTYARFRVNTLGGLLPQGQAMDGEVEDYRVTVGDLDYGDAPNGAYPTRLASDGARHVLSSSLFLGAAVDAEFDGQPNQTAAGDDKNGSTPDDEDGVTFTSLLVPNTTASLTVTASAAGQLNAWVDFNRNGVWEAGEQLFTNQALAMGANTLTFPVPAGASLGTSWARFRVNVAGNLLPTGQAADGEVEDYQVTIGKLDWGDAPNGAYPTRRTSNGARHVLSTGLFLGAAVDAEVDGQPNQTATGDDKNGSTPDDEDGVTLPTLNPGTTANVTVTASAAGGLLNAWVDFNRNGIWEASEQVFADVALAMGANALMFAVPAGASPGTSWARFRVDAGGGLTPTGEAPDGEVEDYEVTIEAVPMDDSYDVIGNVGLTVPDGPGDLTDNDPPGSMVMRVQAGTGPCPCTETTDKGGTVTVQANGSFTYEPPVGFKGADEFDYFINGTGANAALTVQDMIWFIDNSAGLAGDGRLNTPFSTLAAFEAVNGGGGTSDPAAGEAIFIHAGSGDYTGGVTLENDQNLIGQGASSSIATILSLIPPTFSNPLPMTGGTAPNIVNASGDGIVLAAGNTIQGLDVGDASGIGITDPGGTVGTLTISDVTIDNTTGGGVELINGGALDVTFDGLSSISSSDEGIHLASVSGSFSVTTGDINSTNQQAVSITGSGLTLGVTLTNVTSTNPVNTAGIFVDGVGGSFNVTGTATTTGGSHGVRVDNSTAAFSFNSVNISSPVLSVQETRDGAGFPTNDGTGDGIFLDGNTGSFTISGGTISSTPGEGIDYRNSSGLALSGVTIDGTGTTPPGSGFSAGLRAVNSSGTNSVTGGNIQNFTTPPNPQGMLLLSNNVSSTWTVDGVTFDETTAGAGANATAGIQMAGSGTASINITVQNGTTFQNIFGDGFLATANTTTWSGTHDINIRNSTFGPPPAGAGTGLQIDAIGAGTYDIDIDGNMFNTTGTGVGRAINLSFANTATMTGSITGNTIDPTERAGIEIIADDNTSVDLVIDGNDIRNALRHGILFRARDNVVKAELVVTNNLIGVTGGIDREAIIVDLDDNPAPRITIHGNTFTSDAAAGREVIEIDVDDAVNAGITVTNNTLTGGQTEDAFDIDTGANGSPTICLDIRSNSATTTSPGVGYRLTRDNTTSTFMVEGAGTAVVTAADIQSQNTSGTAVVTNTTPGNINFNDDTNCPEPTP